jgi:hypothetical protein
VYFLTGISYRLSKSLYYCQISKSSTTNSQKFFEGPSVMIRNCRCRNHRPGYDANPGSDSERKPGGRSGHNTQKESEVEMEWHIPEPVTLIPAGGDLVKLVEREPDFRPGKVCFPCHWRIRGRRWSQSSEKKPITRSLGKYIHQSGKSLPDCFSQCPKGNFTLTFYGEFADGFFSHSAMRK